MNNKWFSFKFLSSVILLVVTTIWTIMYETSVNSELWFCVWAICVIQFVDALDDIGSVNDKN